jgi:excisionase family DNA binding protein
MIPIQVLSKDEIRDLLKEVVVEVLTERDKSFQTHSGDTSLMDRKTAAKLLGVSLPTLDQYTKEGTIPAKRIGKKILYRADEILNCGRDMMAMKYKRRLDRYV